MGNWLSKDHRGQIFTLQTGGYKHALESRILNVFLLTVDGLAKYFCTNFKICAAKAEA